jgi:hypothetical protein
MSEGNDNLVKFLSVDVKSSETPGKLKAKVLKAIHNSEKRTSTITHPLQSWTDESHSFQELRADQVVKVVANSSHVAFLLSDGRVCRVCVNSWEESSGSKTLSLDVLRQPQERPSFQVLGDEEYARQLQAELNSDLNSDLRIFWPSTPASWRFDLVRPPLQGIEVPGGGPW